MVSARMTLHVLGTSDAMAESGSPGDLKCLHSASARALFPIVIGITHFRYLEVE